MKINLRYGKTISRFAIFLAALVMIWILWANTALELNHVVIKSEAIPKDFSGYRIAHISDYHNTKNRRLNHTLLAYLKEIEPDMIAITGDLIDSRRTDINVALQFAEQAVKIAPCYYVPGNHESRIEEYEDLKSGLEALGVEVLGNERILLKRGNDEIALIGVNDPKFMTKKLSQEEQEMERCLSELCEDDDTYRILLSHRPELFDVYKASKMNLIFSGHAHGGQFRLPFLGGLIAPNQGLFPKYDAGIFTEGETSMVVSRGVGNSIMPIRLNNRPEVVLVELQGVEQ